MKNLWSENIQGVLTLYLSRKLRFHDTFMKQYMDLFDLDTHKKLRILEVGCGPGALAGALHRWYPHADIVAIDRDSRFIEFARQHEPGIRFIEGDATHLPFESHSFDVTISYTVSEHIDPRLFYAEQKRVLREDGVCLVLSCRKAINCMADCLRETDAEKDFWQGIEDDGIIQKYGIGQYGMTERQMPLTMAQNGFSGVSTGFTVVSLTPDNPDCSMDMAEDIINAERHGAIEAILSTHHERADEIIDVVNTKYDRRLNLLRSGDRQWDTYTTVNMVLRGIRRTAPSDLAR